MYNNRNTNKGEKRQCGDFNVSISDFTASNKKKNRHHLKKRAVSVLKHAKTTKDYINMVTPMAHWFVDYCFEFEREAF